MKGSVPGRNQALNMGNNEVIIFIANIAEYNVEAKRSSMWPIKMRRRRSEGILSN